MEGISRYDSLIRFLCDKHSWPWWLRIKAQLLAESSMNPKAVSPVGAKGLAQFMDATWAEWGNGEDPTNPEAAIDACIRYMKWLYGRFEGVPEPDRYMFALAAYNAGIGNVQKMLSLATPQQRSLWVLACRHLDDVTGPRNAAATRAYVQQVMETAQQWEASQLEPRDVAALLRGVADALEGKAATWLQVRRRLAVMGREPA